MGRQPKPPVIAIDRGSARQNSPNPFFSWRFNQLRRQHVQTWFAALIVAALITKPIACAVPSMPLQAPRTLYQQIYRGQITDHFVKIQIQRLLDNLGGNHHLSVAVEFSAIGRSEERRVGEERR